jgi:hypothetical protein
VRRTDPTYRVFISTVFTTRVFTSRVFMSLSTRFKEILPTSWMRFGFCCALALIATLAAPAGSAAAANWTLRQLPPVQLPEGEPFEGGLSGVSCPSQSLCVAVGGQDSLAFSKAPTGDAAAWHVVNPSSGKTCPEENPLCGKPGSDLRAVSCASQNLCVAVSYEGFVYVSTEPTGGAGAWSPTDINESGGHGATHLTAVSCPSPSLCVAVSSGPSLGNTAGKVLVSTEPTSGNWQATQLAGSPDLRGVSCGTPSLCVAVARGGRIFASTDPTGGASTWSEVGTPGGAGHLEGVSCVAAALCAAGNLTGNILTSTDPAGGSATWSKANGGGSEQITGISCPTALRCVAVDNNGDVLSSTDPTGGAGSWHFENLVPYPLHLEEGQPPQNSLRSASCASTSLCALVGSDSRIFTSTNPFSASGNPSSASGNAPGRPRQKAPRRPRTILGFADHFWYVIPTRHRHIRLRFRFFSLSPAKGFECKRDRGPYRRCHSPLGYWVAPGRHVLRVRAIGPTGLRGPAAVKHFRVNRSRAPAS